MISKYRRLGRFMLTACLGLAILLSGSWGALALYYRLPGGKLVQMLGSIAWAIIVLGLFALAVKRGRGLPLVAYLLMYAVLLGWWMTIAPSNHRLWADDVADLMSGQVTGSRVTLANVRNFNWRSDDDYDVRWETRTFDLDHLKSADAVLSYWGSPAIAHTMVSFGFDDGRHVVFSVEIRKKRGEQFSSIGGFFKQFAADERDIIRVRTNVRGEDDYLYPLRMDKPAMRALFLSYVGTANQLVDKPRFYNTITSNCTTLVYDMAKQIDPSLPRDIRLLLTGYLPGYLQKVGALDSSVSIEQLRQRGRITDKARAASPGDDFSKAIRVAQ
jgi:hypothetical protein